MWMFTISPQRTTQEKPLRRIPVFILVQTLCLLSTGCHGRQSSLAPAGRGAEQIAKLFWGMLGGGISIWCLVVGLAVYALKIAPRPHDPKRSRMWIIGGGAVIPTLILTVLLAYGLSLLPGL